MSMRAKVQQNNGLIFTNLKNPLTNNRKYSIIEAL